LSSLVLACSFSLCCQDPSRSNRFHPYNPASDPTSHHYFYVALCFFPSSSFACTPSSLVAFCQHLLSLRRCLLSTLISERYLVRALVTSSCSFAWPLPPTSIHNSVCCSDFCYPSNYLPSFYTTPTFAESSINLIDALHLYHILSRMSMQSSCCIDVARESWNVDKPSSRVRGRDSASWPFGVRYGRSNTVGYRTSGDNTAMGWLSRSVAYVTEPCEMQDHREILQCHIQS
jgi:hypothetical protein